MLDVNVTITSDLYTSASLTHRQVETPPHLDRNNSIRATLKKTHIILVQSYRKKQPEHLFHHRLLSSPTCIGQRKLKSLIVPDTLLELLEDLEKSSCEITQPLEQEIATISIKLHKMHTHASDALSLPLRLVLSITIVLSDNTCKACEFECTV